MASGNITVELTFANPRGVRALRRAAELAVEIAEDQPCSDNARELIEELRAAAREITVRQVK